MIEEEVVSPDLVEAVMSCRVCGNSSFRDEMSVGAWRLVRCATCDIVFTSPRFIPSALDQLYASEYYEQASDYFRSQSAEPNHDHLSRARQAARHLEGEDLRSIDIGTGGGCQVAAFASLGFKASGTERSEIARRTAQASGLDVIDADLLSLPADAYDCVTAFHVLEHVPEPLEFARHLARIARPGGIVVIEVPNYASVSSRRLGPHWPALYPATHLFQFTPATLGDLCRRVGLSVVARHLVGGAGVFSAISDSGPPGAQETASQQDLPPETRIRWTQALWGLRTPLLGIPGVRGFARWVNWELLGRGEYVRIIARKPRSVRAPGGGVPARP